MNRAPTIFSTGPAMDLVQMPACLMLPSSWIRRRMPIDETTSVQTSLRLAG